METVKNAVVTILATVITLVMFNITVLTICYVVEQLVKQLLER